MDLVNLLDLLNQVDLLKQLDLLNLVDLLNPVDLVNLLKIGDQQPTPRSPNHPDQQTTPISDHPAIVARPHGSHARAPLDS